MPKAATRKRNVRCRMLNRRRGSMVPTRSLRSSFSTAPRAVASGASFKFTQRFFFASPSVNCAGNLTGSYTFSLNQLPDASNLINLYDEYQIQKVVFTFRPTANVAAAAAAQFNSAAMLPANPYSGLGLIHTCLDFNDSSAPASAQAVVNYRNSKTTRSDEIHVRELVPRPQGTLFRSGISSGYYPLDNAWIPVAYNDVPHYALKYALEGGPGDAAYTSFQVSAMAEITVLFRNQH